MTKFRYSHLTVLIGAIAAGCSITPTVKYNLIQSPADKTDEQFDQFYLQGSRLTITRNAEAGAAQAQAAPTGTAAGSTPQHATAPVGKKDKKTGQGGGAVTGGGTGGAAVAGGSGNAGGNGGSNAGAPYSVESAPVEPSAFPATRTAQTPAAPWKIGIAHDDHFWSSTNIVIGKLANKDVVHDVGTDVTDNRVTTIESIGSLVTTAAAFGAFSVTKATPLKESFPYIIDVTAILDDLQSDRNKTKSAGPLWYSKQPGLIIRFLPVPVDAQWLYDLQFPFSSHQFLYAACRTAEVSFYDADGQWDAPDIEGHTTKVTFDSASGEPDSKHKPVYTTFVKVADPHFLQMVEMPVKGTITFDTQCGVSVATEAAKTSSDLEVAKAALASTQAVIKAFSGTASSSGTTTASKSTKTK